MWEGDSLTVIFGLAGMSLAAAIGALTLPSGRKQTILWVSAGFFCLLVLGWITAPWLGSKVQTVKPVISSLVLSGAPIAVGVVGIVALMLRNQAETSPVVRQPAFDNDEVVDQIDRAINAADWEDYQPDASSISSGLAELGSAFTTLQKAYSITTPNLTEPSKGSLVLGVRFLRKVRPYIVAGHTEEAKSAAETFLGK